MNWFTLDTVDGCLLDICHRCGLGATYTLILILLLLSLCANDSNCYENLYDPQTYNVLTIYRWILSLTCLGDVNSCGSCTVVIPLPQIAKLTKKPQCNGFKSCELI